MDSFFRGLRRHDFLAALSAFFVVMALLFPGTSSMLGKEKKPTPASPTADLAGRIESLGRTLLNTPLDESDDLAGQIQKLVLDDLQEWFGKNAPGPSAEGVPYEVRVRREMESSFSKLHYPVYGQPKVFSQSWNSGVVTVCGYTLGWSDYDRVNVVALYETRDGKTQQAGIDHFVQRTGLDFELMPAPDSTSLRFMAYGIRLGKSQPRLSAVLYGYDGQSLKVLWQVRDAYDGKIDVNKDTVTIRYLKEDEYIREIAQKRKPPRHLAIYKSSPQGLTLESDTQIPF
jgi:hypothetical protein